MAARNLNVVAVDSEADNLAFIKKSAELMNKRKFLRFINNAVRSDWIFRIEGFTLYLISDEYRQLFAIRKENNPGMTIMKTDSDLSDSDLTELLNATRYSVKLRDILNTIETDALVLKIDIEGYECKVTTTD